MTSLIEIGITIIGSVAEEWYKNTFAISLNAIPSAILSFLLTYLVIQLFLFIFPPLRKFMMIIGAPFRYLHVYLHLDAARRIAVNKYGVISENPRSLGFWADNTGNDTKPLLYPYFSTSDALKVASAPFLGGIALFIFLLISSPIFSGMRIFGLVFHIYLIFCCFGLSFPSFKDYSFLINGSSIRAGGLHPGYILWAYFVFAISGYIALQRSGSALVGFQDGLIFTMIYLVLLLVTSRVTNKKAVTG